MSSQSVIRAYEMGKRDRMLREREQYDREDRTIERDILRARLKETEGRLKQDELKQKLQAALMNRQGAMEAIQATEGQPGLPISIPGQTAEMPQGVPDTAPDAIKELLRGKVMQMRAPDIQGEIRHAPRQIPGVQIPEGGIDIPGFRVRPKTQQEGIEATLRTMMMGLQQKRAEQQVEIPGVGRVDARAIPAITAEANRKAADARTTQSQQFTAQQNALNREASDRRAALNRQATINAAQVRANIAEATKGLPTPVATKIEDIGSALKSLEEITATSPILEGLIGPVRGRISTPFRQYTGQTTEEEEGALSVLQNYFNVLAKARSGGAVTPQEEARLTRELQDKSLSPEQFRGRLKTQMTFMRNRLKLVLGGLPAGQRTKAQEALAAIGISDEEVAVSADPAGIR